MKIVFLDRDGVINKFPGNGNYVTTLKDFHFIPGSLEAIARLTRAGYTIFVVSNQAGVGKGVYSKQKLDLITRHMLKEVKENGGKIKKAFYCIHRSDVGCDCRKPAIGSVVKALAMMNKNIRTAKKAYFVGDTEADIKAGFNAGCKTIFVLSGREDHIYMRRWDDIQPDFIAKDLLEATRVILSNISSKGVRSKKKSASRRKRP